MGLSVGVGSVFFSACRPTSGLEGGVRLEAVMHESWWLLLLNVGLLLCGACLEIFYLCHCCCFRALERWAMGVCEEYNHGLPKTSFVS